MSRKALTLVCTLLALALDQAAAVPAKPSRADASSLQKKVASVLQFAERPGVRQLRTTVTENEVNAYFIFDGADKLPPGVVLPVLTLVGAGRVSARVLVDLDAVRKQKTDRRLLDPLNYFTGRVPVTAVGVLKTSRGVARVELESTALGGVPVPKIILQELVSYYSRTPAYPAGLSLDDPFMLPARIQDVHVEAGRAVVVQ
jgi:hypothetical protein